MSAIATASDLRDRIQLLKARQVPDAETGGFVRSYETLIEIWSRVTPLSHGTYIRGVQAGQGAMTHEVTIRQIALEGLRGEFSKAFDFAFKSEDLHPLKSEFFILDMSGDSGGNLMRVRRTIEVGRSQLSFLCEEMEERGTGWDNG